MSVLNVSPQVFEVSVDAYDPDYHWGGISIYPEGPIPTQVEYPGLPAGMTLPTDVPIDLDLFVTPAPPHLAHIPLECPGAPRPDRKPVQPRVVEFTPLETDSNMEIYSPLTSPTFVYADESAEDLWSHFPEHIQPFETQVHEFVVFEEESYGAVDDEEMM